MKVRILNASDAKAYRELRLKGLKESPHAFGESYEDECEKSLPEIAEELTPFGNPPEQFTLGAISEQGGLLGVVTFKRDTRSKARHKAMLYAMYVLPEARHHGVGQALLAEIVARARHIEGLEQIHLWVLHASRSAADFYKQCGFEFQGPRIKGDLKISGEYVDAQYMVLRL
ncbi:MAG: GNAT family N-acetyltransferase [bacterium]